MEKIEKPVSSRKQALLQVIYNTVIPGDNQEQTRSRKYIGSWQRT